LNTDHLLAALTYHLKNCNDIHEKNIENKSCILNPTTMKMHYNKKNTSMTTMIFEKHLHIQESHSWSRTKTHVIYVYKVVHPHLTSLTIFFKRTKKTCIKRTGILHSCIPGQRMQEQNNTRIPNFQNMHGIHHQQKRENKQKTCIHT